MSDLIFKYKASQCHTIQELEEGLLFYANPPDFLSSGDVHNYVQVIDSFKTRLAKLKHYESLPQTRIELYHRCVVLSVEFLLHNPDGLLLTELFTQLKAALSLAGVEWDTDKMYTANVVFSNAFTIGEKKISFINHLLQSGLHAPKTIINLINQFIMLVNCCEYVELLSVELPNRRTLHEVDFSLNDFKY